MSNRDDFGTQAAELGEQILNQAMNKATVDMVRVEQFIPRITDELWNAYVAGQESVERINETTPIGMPPTHGDPVHLHVERRGKRSLMFAGRGEREAAFKILEQWVNIPTTIMDLGEDLQSNGRSLQEYGGWNAIEGRIRETVGMEFHSLGSLLIMNGESSSLDIMLADNEDLFKKLEAETAKVAHEKTEEIVKAEADNEDLQKHLGEPVQADPGGEKAEAEARLAALQDALQEVEGDYCTQENVELRRRILDDMRRCKATMQSTVYPHHVTIADSKDEEDAEAAKVVPMQDIRVRITEHEDLIVIECVDHERGIDQNGWYPKKPPRFGSSIEPTKAHLGISAEAIALMRKMPRNHDDVGDLMWKRRDGVYRFTWWGPMFRVIDPLDGQAARDFRIWPEQYVEIPNETNIEAIDWIGKHYGQTDSVAWRDPIEVPE